MSVGAQVAPGGVELRPRRSEVVRGSQELQNGGLRALEAASTMIFRLRHGLSSLVVFGLWEGKFLAEEGLASWRAVSGAEGRPALQNSGLRAPADAWRGGHTSAFLDGRVLDASGSVVVLGLF